MFLQTVDLSFQRITFSFFSIEFTDDHVFFFFFDFYKTVSRLENFFLIILIRTYLSYLSFFN